MCGRYSESGDAFIQIRLQGLLPEWAEREPRYNIAPNPKPGSEPWILRATDDGGLVEARARWWLIPKWWKKPLNQLSTTFNARSETAASKPFFRDAYKNRRCVVPASGWREFKGAAKAKRPFQFHTNGAFGFAGLWESWESPEGDTVESFTVLTAPAMGMIAPIHSRMPIVLSEDEYLPWIQDAGVSGDIVAAASVRLPAELAMYESDPIGNSTRASGPQCIAPVAQRGLFD